MSENLSKAASTQSVTIIATPSASKYLQQLCKHFGHKVPASFDTHQGQITFPFGESVLKAEGETLTIQANAPDDEQLAQLQEVIASHLVRFAFREDLALTWQAA